MSTGGTALERRLTMLLKWLAIASFGSMMLLTCLDVVCRYILDRPVKGMYEITQYLMAIGTFGALPLVGLAREHVSVSLFDTIGGAAFRRWRGLLIDLVSLGAISFMTWQLFHQGLSLSETGTRLGGLDIPFAWLAFYSSLLGLVSALVLACQVGAALRGAGGSIQNPGQGVAN